MKKTTNPTKTNPKTPQMVAREKLASHHRIVDVRTEGEGYVVRYYDELADFANEFSPELNTKPELKELFFTT